MLTIEKNIYLGKYLSSDFKSVHEYLYSLFLYGLQLLNLINICSKYGWDADAGRNQEPADINY